MMQAQTIGKVKIEVRGVARTFEAIQFFSNGGDFGLPDKGYAFLQVETGYAGTYIPVENAANALKAVRVLAADFINVALSIDGGES